MRFHHSLTIFSNDKMFVKSKIFSTERWMILFVFDAVVRNTFLSIYSRLFDTSYSKPLKPLDVIAGLLQAICMGFSIFLINYRFILVLVRVVRALELFTFLTDLLLCVYDTPSFSSPLELCLAIFCLMFLWLLGFKMLVRLSRYPSSTGANPLTFAG
jgi:hypothetical protein